MPSWGSTIPGPPTRQSPRCGQTDTSPASGEVMRVVGLDGTTLLVARHPNAAEAAFGPE